MKMKWLDRWIEKQYFKKHMCEREVCEIKVTQVKPIDIDACVEVNLFNLPDLHEDDLYRALLNIMLPEIKQVMDVKSEVDYRRNSVTVYGRLQACAEPNRDCSLDWGRDFRNLLRQVR